ncbi:hypothetical protein OKJ48_17245 [Streptomyces kunmingensis]|uniref:Uncharacterized protein n=1 Tax=Streptomyces kunmingensis TaxID=68225 RepID=A0ABU6CBF2_9ACTN|nr:hypothetical protein [Streptomyces kunmingensis]MEB3961978.1 hypothetical protein [Streptomyces kunmingensis]
MLRRWPTPLVLNLLLGIPGVVPIWLLWYLISNWTDPAPTENDGMALWLVIIVPVVGLYALLWWFPNRALARRTTLTAQNYWLLSAAGTLLPTAALILLDP